MIDSRSPEAGLGLYPRERGRQDHRALQRRGRESLVPPPPPAYIELFPGAEAPPVDAENIVSAPSLAPPPSLPPPPPPSSLNPDALRNGILVAKHCSTYGVFVKH